MALTAALMPPETYLRARRTARRIATAERMPLESHLSLPLPSREAGRQGLLFLVGVCGNGEPPPVTRPWLSVHADLDADDGFIVADWHGEPGGWALLGRSRSDGALAAPASVLRALEREYEELVEGLARAWDPGAPLPAAALRLRELLCFLAPPELLPWYRAASGAFVDALESAWGVLLAPTVEAPAPRPDLLETGPSRGWLSGGLLRPERDHLLSSATLARAVTDLGLTVSHCSPLLQLGRAVGGFKLQEMYDGGARRTLRAAVATLCDPRSLVEVLACDGRVWSRMSFAVSEERDDGRWVLHDFDGDDHLVSFPRSPEEVVAVVAGFIGSTPPSRLHDVISLSRSAAAALFVEADVHHGTTQAGRPVSEAEASTVAWAQVTPLLVPFGIGEPDLAGGAEELRRAGWTRGPGEGDASAPTLRRNPVDALGTPKSVVALRVLRRAAGSDVWTWSSGLVAVRSSTAVWLCGVEEEWGPDGIAVDPAIQLVAVDPLTVLDVVSALVDTLV